MIWSRSFLLKHKSIYIGQNQVFSRKLRAVANHRLVGFDCVPLKVLGSVMAPLSIPNAHFRHEFIVAEGLTTVGVGLPEGQ